MSTFVSPQSRNLPSTLPRGHRRAGRLACAFALALGLVVVAGDLTASAATFRRSLGTVSAELTYAGTVNNPHGTRLTVTNAGHVVYQGVVSTKMCGTLCWPEAAYGSNDKNPLRVVRLAPGLPDVVLGLYSGGAHCCFVDLVFSPGSSSKYAALEIDLGDPGARLVVLPGSPFDAFMTADDSFAYQFTDFAASGLPIKILRLEQGRVVNVTRQYSSSIRSDAKTWLAAFRSMASSHYADSVGVIAAWAADQYSLGRSSSADRFLEQQAAAGHLNSLLTPSLNGATFVTRLEKFLHRRGY